MFCRRMRFASRLCLVVAHPLLVPSMAHAQVPQVIGTFRWQLAPFCNVVTVTVSQVGGLFTLDGFDDQCGAATRAAIVGTAFLNPSGSIGIGLSLVATPGAAPVHVEVTLDLATISGPWRDSAGNTGTLVFNPSSPAPGLPRPATGGLISTVSPGAGLSGGGTTGAVTLAVNYAGSGAATTVARSDHTHAASGVSNTRVGDAALAAVTIGRDITAIGFGALNVATTASYSTAVGSDALKRTTTGRGNTAIGNGAMSHNVVGEFNTAVGQDSLLSVKSSNNVGIGNGALWTLTTGANNVALGDEAGFFLYTGSHNVYIASGAKATNESNTIRIGNNNQDRAFLAGVYEGAVDAPTGTPVFVDWTGKLGTIDSSARFKEDIRALEESSVLRLQPVTFRYKPDQGRGDSREYGLIAEQVAEVIPDLVIRDDEGRPRTVKYHLLPTLMLAEIQRLEREREAQAKEIQELRDQMREVLQRHR